jgi:hypothetical protein
MSASSHLTESGIPGVGIVPFGIHLCHFYTSREDLLASLNPYCKAGLRNNEACIWVTCAPLPVRELAAEISQDSELQAALERGQLRLVDALEWYGPPDAFNPEAAVQKWIFEEELARAQGYTALRITGNTGFVSPEAWPALMDYERLIHQRLQGRRIVTCCSYSRHQCDPVGVLEVVQRHHAALDQADGRWQVFTRRPGPEAGIR